MMIAVRPAQRSERLSAVVRNIQRKAKRVNRLVILRVDADLTEHPAIGAGVGRHERIRLGHLAPVRSAIVAAIDFGTANTGFHDRTLVGIALAFTRWRTGLVA